MKKFELKKTIRLAVPLACAGVLAACAPYEPYNSGVYNTSGPVVSDTPVAAFDRLDTNRDGFLSRGEVEPLGLPAGAAVPVESAADTFRRLDTNADGFLSRAEAGATFNGIPGGSFDAFDTNRDGFLNMTEAMPHLQWLQSRAAPSVMSFDALDADRDGFLSRAEAAPLMSSTYATRRGYAPAPVLSFERLDADRDGYLTRVEAALIANPATFDRFDTNRDGFLSRAEAEPLFRSGVGGTYGATGGTAYGPR
jgi:Ca2+-binding EF-hand superfamily protein